MRPGLKTLIIFMMAHSIALAQTSDMADATERYQIDEEQKARTLESERARLGNQRIQTEAEIRAREEQRRLDEAEQERRRAQDEATRNDQPVAASSGPAPKDAGGSDDMSRTLQQLRSLGELKDDGYITEDEFRRIKQKILDSRL
ncbi:MAG: SHOCT domain-containing protein [Woeseiaceae bacterium]